MPFWILLQQEMMGWQWHQLDHMQIICTSLHSDKHVSTPQLSFLQARCPSCRPTNSTKALKAELNQLNKTEITSHHTEKAEAGLNGLCIREMSLK